SMSGQLSKQELRDIVRMVTRREGGTSLYTALHILGHAGDASYEAIVSAFLDSQDNPMLARLALQILCSYWGLCDQYVEEVRQFVDGVAWDEGEDVRLAAISIGGDYLGGHEDRALADALLSTFEDRS